VSRQ